MKKKKFKKLMKKARKRIKKVLKERSKEYGEFSNIAYFTNRFFVNNLRFLHSKDKHEKSKVAIFMLGLKLARLEKDNKSPHFDSIVDFLGYLQLLKNLNIKDLRLYPNYNASKLHKQLLKYANNKLARI